ncbi:MAG: ribulose-phosphate 3-epimerase [Lachnospiraceae bacterium]|nr:ribulose-phosphate 3-epimerase [Lachnospiraceae bacterium]
MDRKGKIAASVMCAGFDQVMTYVREFEKYGIEYLHVDVMDGTFVPNLAYGPDFVKRLRSLTDITIDCHFMVDRAEEKLKWFDFQPGEQVSLHYEGTSHIQRCLDYLLKKGVRPMIAINPGTPIQVLEEVADYIAGVLVLNVNPGFAGQKIVPHTIEKAGRVRRLLDELGHQEVDIEVDGNISVENAAKLYAQGADIFVAGTSSIFQKGDLGELIKAKRLAIGWDKKDLEALYQRTRPHGEA